MNYFNIQPITIYTTPFESIQVNAIEWNIKNLYRNGDFALCACRIMDNITGAGSFSWNIEIPKSVLDQWLDDSVIDDYICSTDSRFIKI